MFDCLLRLAYRSVHLSVYLIGLPVLCGVCVCVCVIFLEYIVTSREVGAGSSCLACWPSLEGTAGSNTWVMGSQKIA